VRPTADVIEEIKHTRSKKHLFWRPAIFAGKTRPSAMELMEAMIPLKFALVSRCGPSNLCNDPEIHGLG